MLLIHHVKYTNTVLANLPLVIPVKDQNQILIGATANDLCEFSSEIGGVLLLNKNELADHFRSPDKSADDFINECITTVTQVAVT